MALDHEYYQVQGLSDGKVQLILLVGDQHALIQMSPDIAMILGNELNIEAASAKQSQTSDQDLEADVNLSANPDEKPGPRYCPHCDGEVYKGPVGPVTRDESDQQVGWIHTITSSTTCPDGFTPRYQPLRRGEHVNPVSGSDLLTEHRPAPKDTP